jgi:hypothetical protein
MRDISDLVNDELASLIRDSYGTLPALADACGVNYHGIYSILARSGGERSIAALDLLVQKTGCTYEEAVALYRTAPGEARRKKLEMIAEKNGWTIRELSAICWGSPSYIYQVITGKSGNKHTPNLIKLLDALGLDVERFKALVKNEKNIA